MKRQACLMFLFSGYLFFGKYLDANYFDLELRPVKYRAGIHLDFKVADKTTLYLEDETLMIGSSESGFSPGQINYSAGLLHEIDNYKIILEHQCLHPVDGVRGGLNKQSFSLVEFRYGF